jgi:thermolabile hemolysin
MSMNGHPRVRAAIGFLLAAAFFPSHAASGPFGEANAGVRCHYRLKSDPTGVATRFVKAEHILRGHWRSSSVLPSRRLFFTDASPSALRDACNKRLARESDANGLVMVGAEPDDQSYNYEIWYNGDLAPGKPIERIVSFGDSLSDTGNMFNESQWKLPGESWFLGRFSNGPTWIEHLASRNDLMLNNWAIGGAQTRDAHLGLIHGATKQIDGFFDYMKHAKGYDPSRTLFTFLLSGNDFVNDKKTAPQIIQDQETALRTLVERGARKIVIVNLPDVSMAPVFRMGRTDAHTVLENVEYYNAHIDDVAKRVAAASGAEIHVVDARTSFDEVLHSPARFGFIDTTDSCLAIDSESSLSYLKKQSLRLDCEPSRYVFWDTLHPTTRVHELMAGWVKDFVPASWGLR